jgi:uncharacterized protein YlaI
MTTTPPAAATRAPNMAQRSLDEVRSVAHLVEAVARFGGGGTHGRGLADVIFDGLCLGDDLQQLDWATREVLPDSRLLMFEYDGGYWHGEARLEGDLAKSQRLLDANPEAVLVRLRTAGAPPFPLERLSDDDRARTLVVHSDARTVAEQTQCAARALAARWLPAAPTAAAAPPVGGAVVVEQALGDVLARADATFAHNRRALAALVGEDRLVPLLRTHGVLGRLAPLRTFLEWLRDQWKLDAKQLTTFMCDSIAAKVGTPEEARLRAFLEWLRDQWKLDAKQLSTFMCNGVAAKVGTPEEAPLRTFLEWLRDQWKLDAKQLTTFMCNGVAAKVGTPGEARLRAFLEWLRDQWKLDAKQLSTFMCDGVAAKVGTPEEAPLRAFLEWLRDQWKLDAQQLSTFMCGGVAAKVGTPGEARLREGLERLHPRLGSDRLAHMMHNSLACRLDGRYAQFVLRLHECARAAAPDAIGADRWLLRLIGKSSPACASLRTPRRRARFVAGVARLTTWAELEALARGAYAERRRKLERVWAGAVVGRLVIARWRGGDLNRSRV